MREGRRIREYLGIIHTKALQYGGTDSRCRVKENEHHAYQHYRGYEVRRIGRSLGYLLQPSAGRIIEYQRQYDRDGKAEYQSVFQQLPEHGRVKKLPEIPETHPFTAPDAFGCHEVLKSYLQTCQRHIMKDNNIDDHGEQK